jgi:hypothetical protein
VSNEALKDRAIEFSTPVMSQEDQISLIIAWLENCDKGLCGSGRTCRPAADRPLPTRLVDLHSVNDGDVKCDVKVVKKPVDNLTSDVDYVALSHCWGDLPMEDRSKCQFEGGNEETFCLEDLPKTFRDAIELTRSIGKEYIWIDSLCINQKDKEDWKRESETMHEVFKNAYCTIAATSSKDSHQGFLRQPISIPTDLRSFANSDSFGKYFERIVENGILNNRAWVLQERALSRRTDSNHRWLRSFTASTALAIPMRASRTNTASKTIITRAFSGFHDAVMT